MAKGKGRVVEPISDGDQSWQEFFELLNGLEIPEDFLLERGDTTPREREEADSREKGRSG